MMPFPCRAHQRFIKTLDHCTSVNTRVFACELASEIADMNDPDFRNRQALDQDVDTHLTIMLGDNVVQITRLESLFHFIEDYDCHLSWRMGCELAVDFCFGKSRQSQEPFKFTVAPIVQRQR